MIESMILHYLAWSRYVLLTLSEIASRRHFGGVVKDRAGGHHTRRALPSRAYNTTTHQHSLNDIEMARILRLIACAFATICIGFGVNGLVNPQSAVSFFELDYSQIQTSDKPLIDTLLAAYAVRDIFMGVALYAAAFFGTKKTLGFITLAVGAVAGADGLICKTVVGHGEWNHWGYAPMAGLVGLALLVM